MTHAVRIVARYRLAQGVSFIPDFTRALRHYEETGDSEEVSSVVGRVVDLIAPGRTIAPWFHALGTSKRNTLKALLFEGIRLQEKLGPQTRGEPITGLRGRTHKVMELAQWGKGLRTLELASEAANETRSLSVDGWKVVSLPGLTKAQVAGALGALELATSKLRSTFPQVIYGDVYLSTHLEKGVAAWYVHTNDRFYISVNAKKRFDDTYTILHELGHRFDERFFKDRNLRKRFWDLSTRRDYQVLDFDKALRDRVSREILAAAQARKEGRAVPKLSDEAVVWIATPGTSGVEAKALVREYLAGTLKESDFLRELAGVKDMKIQTEVLLHGPLAVTPYGAKKPAENFAEAFAHYVLGMDQPKELRAILEELAR